MMHNYKGQIRKQVEQTDVQTDRQADTDRQTDAAGWRLKSVRSTFQSLKQATLHLCNCKFREVIYRITNGLTFIAAGPVKVKIA
jgi:hypothetical protein